MTTDQKSDSIHCYLYSIWVFYSKSEPGFQNKQHGPGSYSEDPHGADRPGTGEGKMGDQL